jgi:hypothetical protein
MREAYDLKATNPNYKNLPIQFDATNLLLKVNRRLVTDVEKPILEFLGIQDVDIEHHSKVLSVGPPQDK